MRPALSNLLFLVYYRQVFMYAPFLSPSRGRTIYYMCPGSFFLSAYFMCIFPWLRKLNFNRCQKEKKHILSHHAELNAVHIFALYPRFLKNMNKPYSNICIGFMVWPTQKFWSSILADNNSIVSHLSSIKIHTIIKCIICLLCPLFWGICL